MRDFGNALMAAIFSIGLTIGALSISLVGFAPEETPAPTATPIFAPVTATITPLPSLTPAVAVDLLTWTTTNTVVPPITCPPPAGWIAISVQTGETLDSLALRYRTTREELRGRNCLVSDDSLIPGKIIYVPPAPTSTVAVCIPGASGWIKGHVVVKGDTFYNIGARYGYPANLISSVNCRSNSDVIYVGEALWVPNIPTRTPTNTPPPGVTFTPAPLLTEPITQTVLPFTATYVPTQTPISATSTTAPTPTSILTQTASPTAFPSNTSTSSP